MARVKTETLHNVKSMKCRWLDVPRVLKSAIWECELTYLAETLGGLIEAKDKRVYSAVDVDPPAVKEWADDLNNRVLFNDKALCNITLITKPDKLPRRIMECYLDY